MKKVLLLILLMTIGMSCSCKKNIKEDQVTEKKGGADTKTSIKKNTKKLVLLGKVEIYPQKDNTKEVYIVVNWKTRSRITYKVINYNEKKRILKLKNRIIKAKVLLRKQMSPWTGKVELLEILEVLKED